MQAQPVPGGATVQVGGGQFDAQLAVLQGVAQLRAVGERRLAVELQADLLCGLLDNTPDYMK